MRSDSKIICDTLVGDPNFTSQILHTENDAGETPYYLGNCNKQTIRAMDFSPGKVVIEQCQNISVTLLAILQQYSNRLQSGINTIPEMEIS